MTTAELSLFDPALRARLQRAHATAATALLAARNGAPWWTGELSASALSTATAVTALTLVARGDRATAERWAETIRRGYAWLIQNQNHDGGWGDTTRSFSNISTTALVWAALNLCPEGIAGANDAAHAAERWLARAAGSVAPDRLVEAVERRYGTDRTFSIPILTMCALCGRLGAEADGWRHVRALPFEVAALPQAWFGALRLPVVSYALPALIAIGQVRHGKRPTRNPVLRRLRDGCRARTLETLRELQPENGGFLEAAPLTSFVVMSLAALGHTEHVVVRRGAEFLEASVRADGSWPIDTNLATWLTTLSVHALDSAAANDAPALAEHERHALRAWLLGQQHRQVHRATLAAPGGWAWTDLPGGVPDADDTAGAILALAKLAPNEPAVSDALQAAAGWLRGLQNRDGGIPTFCRGWGRLPFDRSSPDITAHAIRAWIAARPHLPPSQQRAADAATIRAMNFLRRTQRADGTWIPLWFGHQEHPNDENSLYGTTRVLLALLSLEDRTAQPLGEMIARALQWLLVQQHADGGWAGAAQAAASLEETSLALEALATAWERRHLSPTERAAFSTALRRGGAWLAEAIEGKRWHAAAPIGFYFAKLWYFEKLYPLIFATGALARLTEMR